MSFAFSLKSFIFYGSSQMLCHEGYSFKGASGELVGIGCGPSGRLALLGSLSNPFSCPRQLRSWSRGDKSRESCTASVCGGSPVPGSMFKKHCSVSTRAGHRVEAAVHTGQSVLRPANWQGNSYSHVKGGQLCQVGLPASHPASPCSGQEGFPEVLCYNQPLYS